MAGLSVLRGMREAAPLRPRVVAVANRAGPLQRFVQNVTQLLCAVPGEPQLTLHVGVRAGQDADQTLSRLNLDVGHVRHAHRNHSNLAHLRLPLSDRLRDRHIVALLSNPTEDRATLHRMANVAQKEEGQRKRVQRLTRQLKRAQALPRSKFRSQRIRTLRTKLTQAQTKLAETRKAKIPLARREALELITHRWSRFVFTSPTGGTAKVGLQQFYSTGKAFVASPESADTGRYVVIDQRVIEFCLDLCDIAKGPVLVNCIVNGDHSEDSAHYEGRAVDIDKNSAVTSGEVEACARRHGLWYLNEDQWHWHNERR